MAHGPFGHQMGHWPRCAFLLPESFRDPSGTTPANVARTIENIDMRHGMHPCCCACRCARCHACCRATTSATACTLLHVLLRMLLRMLLRVLPSMLPRVPHMRHHMRDDMRHYNMRPPRLRALALGFPHSGAELRVFVNPLFGVVYCCSLLHNYCCS